MTSERTRAPAEVSAVVARYLPQAWAADPSARTRAEAFARSGATEQEFTAYVREEDTRAQRERMEVADSGGGVEDG
jgi:hypothetical protein